MASSRVWVVPAILVLWATSGCGLVFQSVAGWHSESTERKTASETVTIRSNPAGAEIVRRDPAGAEKTLGPSPAMDPVIHQIEVTTESPSAWAVLLGGAAETALAVGAFMNAGGSEVRDTTDGALDGSTLRDSGTDTGMVVLGVFSALFAVTDFLIAAVHAGSGDRVAGKKVVDGPLYTYTARLPGRPEISQTIRTTDQQLVDLAFGPLPGLELAAAPATIPAPEAKVERPAKGSERIIAVMDVEDANAGTSDAAIDPGLVRNVGDQLRIFISERGARTIDRSTQERAFKDQVQAMKSESYKECYDDSCQIDLGKALAASHILRSRITRFGSLCVLNGELVDLKAEVTVAAASAQGDCQAEGFLTMSEKIASDLVAK